MHDTPEIAFLNAVNSPAPTPSATPCVIGEPSDAPAAQQRPAGEVLRLFDNGRGLWVEDAEGRLRLNLPGATPEERETVKRVVEGEHGT